MDFRTEQLILSHQPFAHKLANQFVRRHGIGEDADDLHSIALLALCESARRFDPHRGAAFRTFAFLHITGALKFAAKKARQRTQIAATCAFEFTEAFGYTVHVSYDHAEERFTAQLSYAYQQDGESKVLARQIRSAVRRLPARHRKILAKRFFAGKSQLEIAAEMGFSRSYVSLKLDDAIEQLGIRLGLRNGGRRRRKAAKRLTSVKECRRRRDTVAPLIETAFHLVPAEFTTQDFLAVVEQYAGPVKRGSVTPYLKKWQEEGRIEVVRAGRGREPGVYRRLAVR